MNTTFHRSLLLCFSGAFIGSWTFIQWDIRNVVKRDAERLTPVVQKHKRLIVNDAAKKEANFNNEFETRLNQLMERNKSIQALHEHIRINSDSIPIEIRNEWTRSIALLKTSDFEIRHLVAKLNQTTDIAGKMRILVESRTIIDRYENSQQQCFLTSDKITAAFKEHRTLLINELLRD